jgi:hypothetical protein
MQASSSDYQAIIVKEMESCLYALVCLDSLELISNRKLQEAIGSFQKAINRATHKKTGQHGWGMIWVLISGRSYFWNMHVVQVKCETIKAYVHMWMVINHISWKVCLFLADSME